MDNATAAAAAAVTDTSEPERKPIYVRDLISLGDDSKVYIAVNSFQDNLYIHIRVYLLSYANDGTMIPTKTGACLKVEEWENLLYFHDEVKTHISQVTKSKGQMKVKPIQLAEDSQYYISTSYWKGETKVHIRVFECDNGKLIPKKKGIALSVAEWYNLYQQGHHQVPLKLASFTVFEPSPIPPSTPPKYSQPSVSYTPPPAPKKLRPRLTRQTSTPYPVQNVNDKKTSENDDELDNVLTIVSE